MTRAVDRVAPPLHRVEGFLIGSASGRQPSLPHTRTSTNPARLDFGWCLHVYCRSCLAYTPGISTPSGLRPCWAHTSRRIQPPLAGSVPLSRFTSRVGGSSAFYVRRHRTITDLPTPHKTMKTIAHWIPAALCAFLSLLALSMQIGSDSGAWKPAFYCFLPMCFFFVGSATSQMQREIRELRKQLSELQQKRVD